MSQRRYERTDFEWSIIDPLLPNKPRGVPRADEGKVLNGIYWRLRTGSPKDIGGADIPERYGPATTCYNRFVRWAKLGEWDRIFGAVTKAYDGDLQAIDSSSIKVLVVSPPRLRPMQPARRSATPAVAGGDHGAGRTI